MSEKLNQTCRTQDDPDAKCLQKTFPRLSAYNGSSLLLYENYLTLILRCCARRGAVSLIFVLPTTKRRREKL